MNPILETTNVAAAGGLTQFAAVVLNNSNEASLPGGANAARFGGFAQAETAAGMPARIMKEGITNVVAAGAFNPGEELIIAGVTGKVQKIGVVAATAYNVVATAEEAATADSDIVLARITQYVHTTPA